MVGRAAIGNPWIFSRRDRKEVPDDLVRRTMLDHLERMLVFYGEARGMLLFRKHASRYLRHLEPDLEVKRRLLTCSGADEFVNTLETLFR